MSSYMERRYVIFPYVTIPNVIIPRVVKIPNIYTNPERNNPESKLS